MLFAKSVDIVSSSKQARGISAVNYTMWAVSHLDRHQNTPVGISIETWRRRRSARKLSEPRRSLPAILLVLLEMCSIDDAGPKPGLTVLRLKIIELNQHVTSST
jgi:hypothetical protein